MTKPILEREKKQLKSPAEKQQNKLNSAPIFDITGVNNLTSNRLFNLQGSNR
jgi:hypothetical protein